jgi:hypothetical protein
MSYRPAFDVSTVYYAEKALHFLLDGEATTDVTRLLRTLQKVSALTEEDPNDQYLHLNRAFAELAGYQEKGTGVFIPGPQPNPLEGERMIRLCFGLLCLASIVESICVAEQLIYIKGAGRSSFRFPSVAPRLNLTDLTNTPTPAWAELTLTSNAEAQYVEWIRSGPLATKELAQRRVSFLAGHAVTIPFLDLCSSLYDTSAGLYAPMSIDTFSILKEIKEHQLPFQMFERTVPVTAINLYSNQIGKLNRMIGYVHNGLCYNQLSILGDCDYQPNSVRAPFLFALKSSSTPWSKQRMVQSLWAAVGCSIHEKERAIFPKIAPTESDVTQTTFLFAVVLGMAQSAEDILPAAYRLRQILAPLRRQLAEHGWDAAFNDALQEYCMTQQMHAKVRAEGVTARLRQITFPIPGRKASWLYSPLHRKKNYLNRIRIVADQYRNIFSLAERLEHLVQKQRRAPRSKRRSGGTS